MNFISNEETSLEVFEGRYHFDDGKVSKADYFPNFYSFPMPHLSNSALQADEFECSKSMKRLMEELLNPAGTEDFAGQKLDAPALARLDALVQKQSSPMLTIMTSAQYRRRVAGALARRLTQRLMAAAC